VSTGSYCSFCHDRQSGREQSGRRGVARLHCSLATRPPSARGLAGRKFYFPPSQASGAHSTSVKRKVLLSAPTSAKLLLFLGQDRDLLLRGVCPPAHMLLLADSLAVKRLTLGWGFSPLRDGWSRPPRDYIPTSGNTGVGVQSRVGWPEPSFTGLNPHIREYGGGGIRWWEFSPV